MCVYLRCVGLESKRGGAAVPLPPYSATGTAYKPPSPIQVKKMKKPPNPTPIPDPLLLYNRTMPLYDQRDRVNERTISPSIFRCLTNDPRLRSHTFIQFP